MAAIETENRREKMHASNKAKAIFLQSIRWMNITNKETSSSSTANSEIRNKSSTIENNATSGNDYLYENVEIKYDNNFDEHTV